MRLIRTLDIAESKSLMTRAGMLVIALIAVVQALFFSALAPLLPSLEDQLDLTKTQAGLLVGLFPLGLALVAAPVGLLTSRVGVRPFAVAGLVLLAAASAAFGLADTYPGLLATRTLQGMGSALCWSSGLAWLVGEAKQRQRAAAIGLFTGAGAAGQVIGPAIGGLAVVLGRSVVFGVVAGLSIVLAVVASRLPAPAQPPRQSHPPPRRSNASTALLGSLWLVTVPGLLMGTVLALAPLRLSGLGWGTAAISATFLVTAAVGVAARPWAGRWADRRGLMSALRVLLALASVVTLTLPWFDDPWVFAVCVVVALSTYGSVLGPAMAVASHRFDSAQVAHVLAFALIGIASGAGFFVGSTVGGVVADHAGDTATYLAAAGVCLVTLAGISAFTKAVRPRRPGVARTSGGAP